MAKRPTIADVATAAGVSVATVDRVLNRRNPVREATADRVLQAAERIGFYATTLIEERIGRTLPQRRLGFLLQKRDDPFYRQLGLDLVAATKASPLMRGVPVLEFMDELVPSKIAARIAETGALVDAVAVVAVEHPHVTEAVEALARKGVPVFTLISDLTAPSRAGYLGLDNLKRGRLAAWTFSRLAPRPGPIGILVGTHRYLGQELSEIAFRTYLREHAKDFRPLEPLVNLDDPRLAHEATAELLGKRSDLVGIYMAGGGMAGMIAALREEAGGAELIVVCNELTVETRAALIDGIVDLVIATPTAALAQRAVAAMAAAIARGKADAEVGPTMIQLPAELYVSANV